MVLVGAEVIAFLAVAAISFATGAFVAIKLSGSVATPSPAAPDVLSMREWQQGMAALRRVDVPDDAA